MRLAAFGLVAALAATPASALTIGVFGHSSTSYAGVAEMYTSQGHDAAIHDFLAVYDVALLETLDVIVTMQVIVPQTVADRVATGALWITDLSSSWTATNTFAMLDATAGSFESHGPGTPITLTAAGLDAGFGAGLPSGSWADDPAATANFRDFTDIGPSVEVLAVRSGDVPVLLGGAFGAGYVLAAGWNWQDQAFDGVVDTGNERFLINALGYGAQDAVVPLPAAAPLLAVGLAALAGLARRRRRA